ncbi:MAG: Uma2 family endonuclease [Symploca sp. SIO1C2]|nr:Uma2 family endonuclease [Symploca sp. SIO1C2]
MVNLTIPNAFKVTHEQFQQLVRVNRDWQLERTATGELVSMPPTGSITSNRNLDIEGQLWLWNRQTKLGQAFNSSGGFHLPNGSDRAPDAAWVIQERWDSLTPEQQEGFAPICPDFVVELRFLSDNLKTLEEKMQEYIDNGARLGFLIDRKNQQVKIYKPNTEVKVLQSPTSLSGEEILPGFILDLTEVWK